MAAIRVDCVLDSRFGGAALAALHVNEQVLCLEWPRSVLDKCSCECSSFGGAASAAPLADVHVP